jgi:hypothetical protein
MWFLTSSASPRRAIIDEDLDVMREFIYIRNIMWDLLILALAFLVTCGGGDVIGTMVFPDIWLIALHCSWCGESAE